MNINQLESFKLSDAIKFHDTLNPKLFHGNVPRPEVKKQLILIAKDFISELGIKDLDVSDITISGSNAAYTYTPHSDLDLHILVDMSKLPNDEVYQELFNSKKTIYNDSHKIKIHGVPVELYVQDSNEPVVSVGEFSLLKNKWLRIPAKRRASFDHNATKSKYNKLYDLTKIALKSKKYKKIVELLQTLKRYRQAGLDKGGEFSPENLAYKALRSKGLITKLYQLRDELHSRDLSIESQYSEDYDPNGPPPGPEFKPTMPAGTVRVDVSDVYDWYKLGQHISNLKGLGKHDFGKGPPSTIFSFGSEPEEHKYIKDLEKTGLTTTDIDPIDKNQPKGMKRQKVDPTYNVNERQKKDKFKKTGTLSENEEDGENLQNVIPSGLYFDIDDVSVNKAFRGYGIGATLYGLVVSCIAYYNPKVKGIISPRKNRLSTATNVSKIYSQMGGKVGIKGNKDEYDLLPIKPTIQLDITPQPGATIKTSNYKDLNISYIVDEVGPYRVVLSVFDHKSMRNIGFISATIVNWNSEAESMDQENIAESASGYIPSEKEKNDPRYCMALTVDIKPDTLKKNAKAFGFKVSRSGIPPLLK